MIFCSARSKQSPLSRKNLREIVNQLCKSFMTGLASNHAPNLLTVAIHPFSSSKSTLYVLIPKYKK